MYIGVYFCEHEHEIQDKNSMINKENGRCLCSGHNEAAGNWNMEMGFTEGMGMKKDIKVWFSFEPYFKRTNFVVLDKKLRQVASTKQTQNVNKLLIRAKAQIFTFD